MTESGGTGDKLELPDGVEVDPSDFSNLSLTEAVEVENAIESEYETCPECDEKYIEVGIYNDGSIQFTHGKDGMFTDGCTIEDPKRVKEVMA